MEAAIALNKEHSCALHTVSKAIVGYAIGYFGLYDALEIGEDVARVTLDASSIASIESAAVIVRQIAFILIQIIACIAFIANLLVISPTVKINKDTQHALIIA